MPETFLQRKDQIWHTLHMSTRDPLLSSTVAFVMVRFPQVIVAVPCANLARFEQLADEGNETLHPNVDAHWIFFMPGIEWYCFCPVCLSVVCLSVANFNLRYNFWTVRDRDFHIWHAYFTNDVILNNNKVNDIVTLALTLC